MIEKDLVELLRSTIESDATVSRLFNLFHVNYKYSIDELNNIIDYGVENGYLDIEDVNDGSIHYRVIDWKSDNTSQEVIMIKKDINIEELLSEKATVPKEFYKFIEILN